MDRRLLDACMSGDEQALQELIQHDPLILRRAVTCCEETPLHVAVLCGHLSFVRALLGLNRELASERDASDCVPLHLASAKGSAEIVRELMSVDAELSRARDCCGRTPLHLGVMKGRLDVVREFIRIFPESASERMARGETVFHLSIKYCRLETLKLLVDLLKNDHPQLLEATDDEGNTVLHLAALFKQDETVRYLVSLEEVKAIANATNGNGHTALDDVVEKSPRDFSSFEIIETLTGVGVQRARDQSNNPTIVLHSSPPAPHNPTIVVQPPPITHHVAGQTVTFSQICKWCDHMSDYLLLKHQMNWIADAHGNLMVVATVIASISIQAGINPPGGVWQADTMDNHTCTKPDMCRAGTAVLKDAKRFHNFYSRNTWALVASVGVILLHFVGFPLKNKVGTWLMTIITCLMLDNILGAYVLSTYMMVSPFEESIMVLYISSAWRFMLMFSVIIHTYSIWYWWVLIVSPRSVLWRRKWTRTVVFWVGNQVMLFVCIVWFVFRD